MESEIVPIGSVVRTLGYWNTPDKYRGPAVFATVAKARRYDRSGRITVEVALRAPDGRGVRVVGAVGSVDDFARPRSPRQEAGVLPAEGAIVVDVVPRIRPAGGDRASTQARVEDTCAEIVFRTPAGGRFVLVPLTTHPDQG